MKTYIFSMPLDASAGTANVKLLLRHNKRNQGVIQMKKALCSKVASALLLSAGVLATGVASADTTLTFDSEGNATFEVKHATAGSYTDVFLFDVSQWSDASGTAVVGKTKINTDRLANYGITNIEFFWDNNGTRTTLDSSFSTDDGIEFYPVDTLAAGSYGFIVTGSTAIANTGGAYAGTLNLAPVPEPATYAMLGVGIGLLAFTARRKTNNKLG